MIKNVLKTMIVTLLMGGLSLSARAQYMQLGASVSNAPVPSVELRWKNDVAAPSWTVYRRPEGVNGSNNWGTAIAGPALGTPFVLKGADMTLADTNVNGGAAYEYRVVKGGAQAATDSYLLVGLDEPPIESRGKLILMVDNRFTTSLAPELARLTQDLIGDGWSIIRHDVDVTLAVTNIKALVLADYATDTNNVKSLFLFGHFAIPYSGCVSQDGHSEHLGAWPTDLYYGDMDESLWTDTNRYYIDAPVNSFPAVTNYPLAKFKNVPGDGKFDQNFVPRLPGDFATFNSGVLELEVGRVDLYDMPAFGVTETGLLRRYLDKDHAYRHRVFNPERRGLAIDGSGLTQTGLRNFAAFFGYSNIVSASAYQWFPQLRTNSYLWAQAAGTGPGNGMACTSAGTTVDYANNAASSVFHFMFCSYIGIWDVQNNFLRAPLASQPWGLTCLYGKKPYTLHEMGLGRNIGYSFRRNQSQACGFLWWGGAIDGNLMGDPTLRMFMVAPPAFVTASSNGMGGVALTWDASDDTVAGYHVYRAGVTGSFARLNGSTPVSGTNYTDATPLAGTNRYLVKAVKLESVNSGTYYNLSQGIPARFPAQLNQVVVTTSGGAPQTSPSTNALPTGGYLTFSVPVETKPAGLTVCSWTGTGSVPASGQGTNVTILLDQDSSIQWQWSANRDSTVTVESPVAGSSYVAPASVVLTATAGDPDGLIAKVEFYQGTNLVGQDADSVWDFANDQSATFYMANGQPGIATYSVTWANVATGSYVIRAVAYDSFGAATTSSPLSFTVGTTAVAPTIATQPADMTVSLGQSATFPVEAAGTAPFTYQWRYQNPNAGGGNPVNIPFAIFDSYTTPYPSAGYNGASGTTYSVVVSNQAGSVTSRSALLTLTAAPLAPSITAPPANQTVYAGQTATFNVSASGTSPLSYQWRTNGVAVSGATSASLTTPATVTNHSGTLYSVVVSNSVGSTTSVNATLTVLTASPAISSQPTNQTVTAGQTASFSVTASGTAPLYYQWKTNGADISGASASSHTTPATTTNQSGMLFSVMVSNLAGSVVSSNASLTVLGSAPAAELPFRDSFEAYAPGASVAGTNGWGGEATAGIVTTLTYKVKIPPGYPLPGAAHSRVLLTSGILSNAVPGPPNQSVGVDFMTQPSTCELPGGLSNTVQVGLCVDTQGVAQVWHYYNNSGAWTQRWTALGNPPFGTTQWIRVSVALDYRSNSNGHTLFRPMLNGIAYPTAYGVADSTNLTSPGSWYVCANSPGAGGGGTNRITMFKIKGEAPCLIDDFAVITDAFAYTPPGSLLMIR